MPISNVITTRGKECKVCNKRVGSETQALFEVPIWNNPSRKINLCEKDLTRFEQYQEAEIEHFLTLYGDPIERESLPQEQRDLYEVLKRERIIH